MRPLFIDLPGQPCLAWTVAWLAASRQPERAVVVRVPAAATQPAPNVLGWQPVGSRVLRPEAEAAESLFAFCQDKDVPVDVCGQLFIGGHPDTARLLDLFQSATRRRLNVLNLPPSGLRARYAETGFAPGVRGLLDLDAARIDLDALRSALRERAFELGVQESDTTRPRGCLHLRRGKAPVRIARHGQLIPNLDFPCILSGLPEPDMAELVPVLNARCSSVPSIAVRPAWRTWLPGRRGLVRHQKRWEDFHELLPDKLPDGLVDREAPLGNSIPTTIDAGLSGSPLPFECRDDGRLFGAAPEPIDLFRVAARIVEELG